MADSSKEKRKRDTHQAELMRLLNITPDDIKANEKGAISAHQIDTVPERSMHRGASYTGCAVLFMILFIVVVLIILVDGLQDDYIVMGFLTALPMVAGLLMAGWKQWEIKQEVQRDQVRSVRGRVSFVPPLSSPPSKPSRDGQDAITGFEIGDVQFRPSKDVVYHVEHNQSYVVYYLPYTKIILSMKLLPAASASDMQDEIPLQTGLDNIKPAYHPDEKSDNTSFSA